METVDKTCMSYWFPRIRKAGLPIPKTGMIWISEDQQRELFKVFDGGYPGKIVEPFFLKLKEFADKIGYPCFLRTGHTSGKHSWDDSCFIKSPDDIGSHVYELVEFSECCCGPGLPWDVWAVREFLPTIPAGKCTRYHNMPVNREFRFFAEDGKVICWHPYWPWGALEGGGFVPNDPNFSYEKFCDPGEDLPHMKAIAEIASRVCEGAWSVDLLETERGWYLTDMAEASKSWHWPDCPNEMRWTE